ncbi:hypothetical protein [Rudaea cellulosilytica]|uniref:hypothetical protein n=1 Tax=Rudaea cellulosilytica TaxID=540746 RepID=UPI0012FB0731|nr:hypothetical protein [Rudaea cellulosilytica]
MKLSIVSVLALLLLLPTAVPARGGAHSGESVHVNGSRAPTARLLSLGAGPG